MISCLVFTIITKIV